MGSDAKKNDSKGDIEFHYKSFAALSHELDGSQKLCKLLIDKLKDAREASLTAQDGKATDTFIIDDTIDSFEEEWWPHICPSLLCPSLDPLSSCTPASVARVRWADAEDTDSEKDE